MSLCGKAECGASTGVDGSVTFGSGALDDFGYWEKPCPVCAREWERLNPGETAWPFRKIEKGEEVGPRNCPECSQETSHYWLCDDCIDKRVANGVDIDALYAIEEDAYVSAGLAR